MGIKQSAVFPYTSQYSDTRRNWPPLYVHNKSLWRQEPFWLPGSGPPARQSAGYHIFKNFFTAHRRANGDSFRHGWFGGESSWRPCLLWLARLGWRDRNIRFALKWSGAFFQSCRLPAALTALWSPQWPACRCPEESHISRNSAQLFIGFINVSLCSLVKERIIDMVRVILSFFHHFIPADVGAVIPRTGDNLDTALMGFDHIDLFRRCAFRYKDFTVNTGFAAICRHAVSRIAAAVSNYPFNPELFRL